MLEDCELSKNTLSSMQSRGSWLQANSLAKIADYLDCSVDYLLGRADTPSNSVGDSSNANINLPNSVIANANKGDVTVHHPKDIELSAEEQEILDTYRSLTLQEKDMFINKLFESKK